jgi:formate-dependent nitrite reductase membrane component NrfD
MRWLPFSAPVLVGVGMAALFPHLSCKAHFYRFFTTFELASPMSWEAWLLLAVVPATLLLGLSGLRDDEAERLAGWGPVRALRLGGPLRWGRRVALARERGLVWLNLALGVGLGAYPGFLLGTLIARPAWHSAVLAPLFLVSALLTGAALMRLFSLIDEEHRILRGVNLGAIALQMALVALFALWLATGAVASQQAAATLLFGGRFTALFWSLVVVAGLLVPLVMEGLEARRQLRHTAVAPVLLLLGGLSLRWIVVLAGQV